MQWTHLWRGKPSQGYAQVSVSTEWLYLGHNSLALSLSSHVEQRFLITGRRAYVWRGHRTWDGEESGLLGFAYAQQKGLWEKHRRVPEIPDETLAPEDTCALPPCVTSIASQHKSCSWATVWRPGLQYFPPKGVNLVDYTATFWLLQELRLMMIAVAFNTCYRRPSQRLSPDIHHPWDQEWKQPQDRSLNDRSHRSVWIYDQPQCPIGLIFKICIKVLYAFGRKLNGKEEPITKGKAPAWLLALLAPSHILRRPSFGSRAQF